VIVVHYIWMIWSSLDAADFILFLESQSLSRLLSQSGGCIFIFFALLFLKPTSFGIEHGIETLWWMTRSDGG